MKQMSAWLNARIITVFLIGVGLVYLIVTMLVSKRLVEYELATRLLIADQEATLVAIAEATARNGADAVTESIVRDCTVTERSEFDDLLAKLNSGLSQAQLASLERLFGRCGPFYSERKLVMVARLAREIEIYETYVRQLNSLTGEDLSEAFNVPKWQALSAEEQRQSELFSQLVGHQDMIITTLLAGSSSNSPEIQDILYQVREVQEALQFTNKQASTLRAELVSL